MASSDSDYISDTQPPDDYDVDGDASGNQSHGRGSCKPKWGENNTPEPIQFNKDGIPIDENGCKFRRFVAKLGTNSSLFPFSVTDWREMPKDQLNLAWEICDKTIAWTAQQLGTTVGHKDIRPKVQKRCWHMMNNGRKRFKRKMKERFYDKRQHLPRPLLCEDARIPPGQWTTMVTWWDSPEYKTLKAKNKENRSKMKMHHTAGTRPYAAHQEAYHKLNQEYPDPVKFFGMMHTRKDKTFVDPESEEHAANMDAALAALPEETRQTPAAKNQVFEQEFGDRLVGHGRVFGYGLGVTPSEMGLKSSSSSLSRSSVDAEMADIQAQLAASKAEKESLAAEVRETKSDIAKLKEIVDAQMLMLQQFRQEMTTGQRRVNRRMIEDDYFQQYGVPWQHTFPDFFTDSVVGVSGNANSQGFMPTSTTRHVLDRTVQQGEPNNALT